MQSGDKLVYHLDKLAGPVQVGDTLGGAHHRGRK